MRRGFLTVFFLLFVTGSSLAESFTGGSGSTPVNFLSGTLSVTADSVTAEAPAWTAPVDTGEWAAPVESTEWSVPVESTAWAPSEALAWVGGSEDGTLVA